MARKFGANEVLEVAERMERNAVKFYRKAAGVCADPKICRLFVDLARWEREHVRVFSEMKKSLSDFNGFSRAGQGPEFGRFELDLMDDSPIESPIPLAFGDHEYPSGELAGGWTKAEVLRTAIQKEKDTISFFTNLKEFVPGHHNTQVIKALIREEERHVKILSQSLEQTSSAIMADERVNVRTAPADRP